MSQPGFWDNSSEAKKTAQKLDALKKDVKTIEHLNEKYEELNILLELGLEEGNQSVAEEIESGLSDIKEKLERLKLRNMLNEKYDVNNAILTLHPGAGGTESQDWAEMLLRMYTYWAKNNDYHLDTVEIIKGDEAGIKRATLIVKGEYAYGYLKAEKGIHRLVRISPFDSGGRRHTSFASVEVTPEIDDEISDIEIDKNDLRIDTYRASGAGGQHVNMTDSAVRITHIPTGIVVQCQNERSQHKNRRTAMKILKARLFELMQEHQKKKLEELSGEKREIAWGNQIRSYVMHPYNMVKDHRTDIETGNVDAVMDGESREFKISAVSEERYHGVDEIDGSVIYASLETTDGTYDLVRTYFDIETGELVESTVTEDTTSIWYPKQEHRDVKDMGWQNDS